MAQTGSWRFSFSYGSSIGIARINNKFDFQATAPAFLRSRPQFSQRWYSYDGSGLKGFEKFLYGSFLAIEAETSIGYRYAFQTGLETGGRPFMIQENPSQQGRYPDNPYEILYANRARQNILISSLPFRFIRRSQKPNILTVEPVLGASLNYAYAPAYNTHFYKSDGVSRVFPSLDLGLRLLEQKWDRFSFNLVYQQGFYPISDDQVQLLSSWYMHKPPNYFQVGFKGSNLRFSLNTRVYVKAKKKPANPLDRKKSHELEWDCTGNVELCVLDDGLEDGDSVAIYVGNSRLEMGIVLTKAGYCFPVVCESHSQLITIVPLNEGRIIPNTVRVILKKDGVLLNDQILKSGKDRKIVILLKPGHP